MSTINFIVTDDVLKKALTKSLFEHEVYSTVTIKRIKPRFNTILDIKTALKHSFNTCVSKVNSIDDVSISKCWFVNDLTYSILIGCFYKGVFQYRHIDIIRFTPSFYESFFNNIDTKNLDEYLVLCNICQYPVSCYELCGYQEHVLIKNSVDELVWDVIIKDGTYSVYFEDGENGNSFEFIEFGD